MASERPPATALDHLWLHFTQMGEYSDPCGAPGHRPRRRLLPRGREREALSRRARRPLLREHRLRLRRRDGRGRGRADARAAVRDQLDLRPPALDRAGRRAGARSRPATSTAPSSSPAAPRPSRPPGSSPASTTAPAASAAGRRSRGGWPTTAPPWARSRSPAAPSCALRSSRSCRTCSTCRTPTATTARRGRPRRSSRAFLLDELEATIVQAGPGDGGDGDHGAGAERGRLVHAAGRVLRGRPRALRRARHPALRRRGDHRLRAHGPLVRLASASTSGPT